MHRTVNGCYADSAIPALAFSLATVIAKMCGAMLSAIQQWLISQATPAFLWISGNAQLRKIQRKFYPRDFFRGVQAVGSMKLNVFWKTLSVLILIKEAVICNVDWRIFLVISIFPSILWDEGVSIRGSGTTWILNFELIPKIFKFRNPQF